MSPAGVDSRRSIEGLETLYRKYKDRGLVVLGFPCNQFGHQEPGTECGDSRRSASETTASRSRMFAKIDVNGANAHPLYRHLKAAKKGLLGRESHCLELHEIPGRL